MSGQFGRQANTGKAPLALQDDFIDVMGARVHYVRAGEGPALVLVHGLTGSTANWRKNIAFLAQSATVYAIDLVNMGRSDRVGGLDARLAATADRVAATMDANGLAQADIAGHSHGGAVAMMLAVRHPGRVRSLMLFAPANPYSDSGDGLIRLYSSAPGRLLARMVPYLPRWVQTIALGRMYGDPARIVDGTLDGYVDGLRIEGTIRHVVSIVRNWFADMAELESVLPRLRSVPTLLIWGDRDRAVSLASGQRLHRELPHSELVVLATGGHVVFEELPGEANLAMQNWLVRGNTAGSQIPRAEPSQRNRQLLPERQGRRVTQVSTSIPLT